jgi:hypothetical protein
MRGTFGNHRNSQSAAFALLAAHHHGSQYSQPARHRYFLEHVISTWFGRSHQQHYAGICPRPPKKETGESKVHQDLRFAGQASAIDGYQLLLLLGAL